MKDHSVSMFPQGASQLGRLVLLEEKRQVFQVCQDVPCYPFWYEYVIREGQAWYHSQPVSYALFVIGLEGVSSYTVGDANYEVTPQTMLFIPEFTEFCVQSQGRNSKCLLEVKGSNLTSLLATLNLRHPTLFDLDGHPEFVEELHGIAKQLGSREENDFLEAMGKTYQFMVRLSFLQQQEQEEKNLLQKVLEYLEQDFSRPLSLKEVCAALNMSPSTLTRLTRNHLGMTPMRYRANRKLERAAYYLYIKEMTVKEVAYRLGYPNPFHFSKAFKRFTGLSPLRYRAQQHVMREIGRDIDNRQG